MFDCFSFRKHVIVLLLSTAVTVTAFINSASAAQEGWEDLRLKPPFPMGYEEQGRSVSVYYHDLTRMAQHLRREVAVGGTFMFDQGVASGNPFESLP